MALVCRWFTGQAKVSPKISQFYSKVGNREKLAEDLEDGILPLMYDRAMAAQEVYRLLMQDDTISERVKKECSRYYPCDTEHEEALFIADVLCFGMEREFIKRDPKAKNLLADGKLSPILSDFIADDLPDDSEQERFRKHNRFLRTLKEDTLFIVDNFNLTTHYFTVTAYATRTAPAGRKRRTAQSHHGASRAQGHTDHIQSVRV